MQGVLDFLGLSGESGPLTQDFKKRASKFYSPPDAYWELVTLRTGKTCYLLKTDPTRAQTIDRMAYLDTESQKLWTRLVTDPANFEKRPEEMEKLRGFFEPKDTICRIAQKPFGGYDVRAYAHDSWIFIELPTFSSVETGQDGINTTEPKRRKTLMHILIHELAHVAGYWEHDDKHSKCILWLTRYADV